MHINSNPVYIGENNAIWTVLSERKNRNEWLETLKTIQSSHMPLERKYHNSAAVMQWRSGTYPMNMYMYVQAQDHENYT